MKKCVCLSKVAALDYSAVRSQIQLDKLEAAILDIKTRKRDLQTDPSITKTT